jgi:hypothetical protein
MARKQTIARIDGISTGAGNHAHGVLIEIGNDVDASTLFNLQVTITGGIDGKKRHASALISIDDMRAAVAAADAAIAALS